MDIQTAHSLVKDYLTENDSYSEKNSYKMLSWHLLDKEFISNDAECRAAVAIALSGMVKDGILEKIEFGNGKTKDLVYVSINSLKNLPITIELSKQTANAIAEVVNSVLPFATLEKLPERKGKNIGEQDIVLLIETIMLMKDQMQKNFSEIENLTTKNKKINNQNENEDDGDSRE